MMGTNFYVEQEPAQTCETCGHISGGDEMHIGKSSYGWVFLLNVYPSQGILSRADWVDFLDKRSDQITNEYGSKVSFSNMIKTITERTHPRGLLRPCTEYPEHWTAGDGTYDIAKKHQDFS